MRYDALIVLAGGIQDNSTLPLSVRKRLDLAVKNFQQHEIKFIIVSGKWSSLREQKGLIPPITEAEAMKRYLRKLGISPARILKEESSHTTAENAYYCWKNYLKTRKLYKILVVTSDFHLRRTSSIFKKILLPPYTAEFIGANSKGQWWRWCWWSLKELYYTWKVL